MAEPAALSSTYIDPTAPVARLSGGNMSTASTSSFMFPPSLKVSPSVGELRSGGYPMVTLARMPGGMPVSLQLSPRAAAAAARRVRSSSPLRNNPTAAIALTGYMSPRVPAPPFAALTSQVKVAPTPAGFKPVSSLVPPPLPVAGSAALPVGGSFAMPVKRTASPTRTAQPLATRGSLSPHVSPRTVLVRTNSPLRATRSPPATQRSAAQLIGRPHPSASMPWTLQLPAGTSVSSGAVADSVAAPSASSRSGSYVSPILLPKASALHSSRSQGGPFMASRGSSLALPVALPSSMTSGASASAAVTWAQAQSDAYSAAARAAHVAAQAAQVMAQGRDPYSYPVVSTAPASTTPAMVVVNGATSPAATAPPSAIRSRRSLEVNIDASAPCTPPVAAPLSSSTSSSSAPPVPYSFFGSTGGTGGHRTNHGTRGASDDRDSSVTLRMAVQELLSHPEKIVGDLTAHARKAVDEWFEGTRIPRDVALQVVVGTFSQHFPNLPNVRVDDGIGASEETAGLPVLSRPTWLSLLKRFGMYTSDDCIGMDELCQLYKQSLCKVRDCFASPDFLRAMQTVHRGQARLKDRYDSFEFQTKDCLGKLYRCRDSLTGEPRSCQQIRKDKASAPVDVIRERLASMCELRHPRVSVVYEHLEDFHNFYVISQALDGAELLDYVQDSYVRAGGLTEAWVASVLRQVLEALAHCHAHPQGPILHRDLRPSCVMLQPSSSRANGSHVGSTDGDDPVFSGQHGQAQFSSQPDVLVYGFGFQELFGLHGGGSGILPAGGLLTSPQRNAAVQKASSCFCMPESVAPEAWRLDEGPRCDVFSCGVLMYLLLTGHLPFGPLGMPLKELARAVAAQEPDWRLFRHVSTTALALCRRMLVKDDNARPTVIECLRHPWFSIGIGAGERMPREIRPETLGALVQFYAQAKFQQVLMNVIASELPADRIQQIQPLFQTVDPEACGRVTAITLQEVFSALGISSGHTEQVINALSAGMPEGSKIAYAPFVAGCVELVDDKLDHMLWKVFAMVDEDHSGEMGAIVFEHFLQSAHDSKESGCEAQPGQTDVERYLHSVLGAWTDHTGLVAQIGKGRESVTFEAIKDFVTTNAPAA